MAATAEQLDAWILGYLAGSIPRSVTGEGGAKPAPSLPRPARPVARIRLVQRAVPAACPSGE